ncbi:type I methionyl aminopeptidase [Pseudactinotalea sp. Z1739]|uniref:type I methionyl aminopeptidase n=1 Tax=Pseudactinotalea sp. Z1739 TaxID=3413028 RepID=UPI003C7E140A
MFSKIEYKTTDQIRRMRKAGLVVADIHAAIRAAAVPGVRTAELDAVAAGVLERASATSNFLGYHGYPAHVCLSVNDEVVHGIPGERVLEAGDVLSADCGAVVEGWHGDAAFTVVVGAGDGDPGDPGDHLLSQVTQSAMWAGIAALAKGQRLGVVGDAIQDEIERAAARENTTLGIVAEYVGHGIGSAMHQPPDVLNIRSTHRGPKVRSGLCVAIEPMITRGGAETKVLADDWTVVTTDGSRAAHWEHTVAVHDGGIWVLTAPDGGAAELAARGVAVAPLD